MNTIQALSGCLDRLLHDIGLAIFSTAAILVLLAIFVAYSLSLERGKQWKSK